MIGSTETVILAGGEGTRLAPALPSGWPKVLAPVRGVPFLAYLLDHLYDAGGRRVTLCLGYGATHVEDFLAARGWPGDLSIQVVIEPQPAGTAGALRDALPRVRSDPFLALNGDTYCDADLEDLLAFHESRRAEITVALAEMDDQGRFGQTEVAEDGRITKFSEKEASGARGLVSAGIYAVNASVVRGLRTARKLSWEYDVLPAHAGRGLYGRACCRWFVDVGTPDSLRGAADLIRGLPAHSR